MQSGETALPAALIFVWQLMSGMEDINKKTESREEQIRILRKQRYRLLEEIHCKQQSLDELDYMIDKIKKEA